MTYWFKIIWIKIKNILTISLSQSSARPLLFDHRQRQLNRKYFSHRHHCRRLLSRPPTTLTIHCCESIHRNTIFSRLWWFGVNSNDVVSSSLCSICSSAPSCNAAAPSLSMSISDRSKLQLSSELLALSSVFYCLEIYSLYNVISFYIISLFDSH